MEKPIVSVENLSHRYSVQWAIKNITFEINQKGILGLLGSNGAGKSTTMNIICGVLNQTDGDVFINGINIKDNPVEAKRFIGFLPQKPPLYSDLNVDEYLTYCAYLRHVEPKNIVQAVERAKKRCGIAHFSERLIRNLSGGYQQRLGIAQAIVHNPKFVVLDEPTNGLDPNQIVEVRELIKEIANDHAVLLSTHILSEVQATCDSIKMIEHGKLVFSGSINEFNNYIEPSSFIVVLGNPPGYNDIFELQGVTSIEKLTENKYRYHFENNPWILQQMVEMSVTKGWQLTEITLEKSSLDQVFAQLSGKTNKKEL